MSKNYILVHNKKKDTYSIYDAGSKLKHSKTANVPDSEGEYYIGNILTRGTEQQCEIFAKNKFEDSDTYYQHTDNELPVLEENESAPLRKKSSKSILNINYLFYIKIYFIL